MLEADFGVFKACSQDVSQIFSIGMVHRKQVVILVGTSCRLRVFFSEMYPWVFESSFKARKGSLVIGLKRVTKPNN